MTERRIVTELGNISIVFQCSECDGELAFHPNGKGTLKIANCPQCGRPWIDNDKDQQLVQVLAQSIRRGIEFLKEMPFTVRLQLRD